MDVEIIIAQEIDIKNSGSRVRVSFPAQNESSCHCFRHRYGGTHKPKRIFLDSRYESNTANILQKFFLIHETCDDLKHLGF